MHSSESRSFTAMAPPPTELGRIVLHYLDQIIRRAPDLAHVFDLDDVHGEILSAVEADGRRFQQLASEVDRIGRELARMSTVVALPSEAIADAVPDVRDERRI